MLLGIVTREHGGPGAPSYSRMRFLGTLAEHSPPPSTNSPRRHLFPTLRFVSDAAVSRMLIALVPEGLVTVETDPRHARRRLVRLTAEGAELFHASSRDYATQFGQVLNEQGFPYQSGT